MLHQVLLPNIHQGMLHLPLITLLTLLTLQCIPQVQSIHLHLVTRPVQVILLLLVVQVTLLDHSIPQEMQHRGILQRSQPIHLQFRVKKLLVILPLTRAQTTLLEALLAQGILGQGVCLGQVEILLSIPVEIPPMVEVVVRLVTLHNILVAVILHSDHLEYPMEILLQGQWGVKLLKVVRDLAILLLLSENQEETLPVRALTQKK